MCKEKPGVSEDSWLVRFDGNETINDQSIIK